MLVEARKLERGAPKAHTSWRVRCSPLLIFLFIYIVIVVLVVSTSSELYGQMNSLKHSKHKNWICSDDC